MKMAFKAEYRTQFHGDSYEIKLNIQDKTKFNKNSLKHINKIPFINNV
jgi:hypothetical protein